jgi:hypothetical protein
MSDRYILEGHTPVPEPDLYTWGRWLETADRNVAWTEHEMFTVSTVFLGLDHNFGWRGPPVLFETMAFYPETTAELEGESCWRYSSWDDAETGHKAVVRRLTELARKAREIKLDADLQRLFKGE